MSELQKVFPCGPVCTGAMDPLTNTPSTVNPIPCLTVNECAVFYFFRVCILSAIRTTDYDILLMKFKIQLSQFKTPVSDVLL